MQPINLQQIKKTEALTSSKPICYNLATSQRTARLYDTVNNHRSLILFKIEVVVVNQMKFNISIN